MHGAFITCSRKSDLESHRSKSAVDRAKGLIQGHAYTVTSIATVELISGEQVHLIRVRNPWGDAVEWEGAWSDRWAWQSRLRSAKRISYRFCASRSAKWSEVSDSDKQRLRVTALDDGEFWMNYQDFREQFQVVTVATIGPDFNEDGESGLYLICEFSSTTNSLRILS